MFPIAEMLDLDNGDSILIVFLPRLRSFPADHSIVRILERFAVHDQTVADHCDLITGETHNALHESDAVVGGRKRHDIAA